MPTQLTSSRRFLAVADTGRSPPPPHGARLTALGAAVAERGRRVLRELQTADEAVDAARSGRTGVLRVTANPPWAETVLAPAAARFHEAFPQIELQARNRHPRRRPAAPCRRRDRPPLRRHRRRRALTRLPPPRTLPRDDRGRRRLERPSVPCREGHPPRPLALPVNRLRLAGDTATRRRPPVARRAPRRPGRDRPDAREDRPAGGHGRAPPDGRRPLPRLALAHLPRPASGAFLRPLPVRFDRYRYRAGFVARRSAENLAPFRQLKAILRETALGHPG